VSALLRGNYASAAKDIIAPLVDLLAVARAAFGGDLDKLLIVLVVALRTAEHPDVGDIDFEEVLSGKVTEYPSLRTNVRSIADSTGVPRETVRRKMADLVAAGWITRDGDDLSYTPAASRALEPVREAMIDATERLYGAVRSLKQASR
jgi:CRP-like cAMP-binding protein